MQKATLSTITFGDVAENHARMQKIGTLHERGYSAAALQALGEKLQRMGLTTEYVSLNAEHPEYEEAGVLIIRHGVQHILGTSSTQPLQDEHAPLDVDKKAFMKGRVVNKHARWNLCFDDVDQ